MQEFPMGRKSIPQIGGGSYSIFALFYFFFYFFFSLQYFYFLFLTTQLAVLILSFATDQKTYKSSSGLKNSRQIFSYATVSYHIHKRYHRGFLSVYSNMLHVSILFRILISRSILILSVFNCFFANKYVLNHHQDDFKGERDQGILINAAPGSHSGDQPKHS